MTDKSNKKSFTLLEIVISVMLLSVVSVGILFINISSFELFLKTKDRVILAYELQYVMQHIIDHVTLATVPVVDFDISEGNPQVVTFNYIDKFQKVEWTCKYSESASDKKIYFKNWLATEPEPLGSGDSLTDIIFVWQPKKVFDIDYSKNGNVAKLYLRGRYPVSRSGKYEELTIEGGCSPRMASLVKP